MKKFVITIFVILTTFSLIGQSFTPISPKQYKDADVVINSRAYGVGEIVDDFTWTLNGESTSLSQVTNSGKAVVFFWGSPG